MGRQIQLPEEGVRVSVMLCLTCSHDSSDISPYTRGPRVSEAKVMCAAGCWRRSLKVSDNNDTYVEFDCKRCLSAFAGETVGGCCH